MTTRSRSTRFNSCLTFSGRANGTFLAGCMNDYLDIWINFESVFLWHASKTLNTSAYLLQISTGIVPTVIVCDFSSCTLWTGILCTGLNILHVLTPTTDLASKSIMKEFNVLQSRHLSVVTPFSMIVCPENHLRRFLALFAHYIRVEFELYWFIIYINSFYSFQFFVVSRVYL